MKIITIMKKLYSQPQTKKVVFDPLMAIFAVDAGSDAPGGAWGAPERSNGPKFI